MKRLLSAIVLAGMSAFLAACDPIHGISRNASLPFLPEFPCVEAAIESVPEVCGVRRWTEEGGRPLTLTGIKPPDQLYYFTYDLGFTWKPTLLLSVNYKGEVELSQHLFSIGPGITKKEVDLVRPVMMQIEKALEERCGLTGLVDRIKEY